MQQYLITYLGSPREMSKEQGQKHMQQYQDWLQNLGDSVISPANPIKNTHTVNSDASVDAKSTTTMSGYTIVQAKSIDDAIAIAKDCPFIAVGGSLEVSELIKETFA